MEALGVDYIDNYGLHYPMPFKNTGFKTAAEFYADIQFEWRALHTVWPHMEALVDEGLVKHISVSNWSVALLADLFGYARIKPLVNEIEFHPYYQNERLIDFC
jgi:diketogulonate reductase-like aldo/keto reductase